MVLVVVGALLVGCGGASDTSKLKSLRSDAASPYPGGRQEKADRIEALVTSALDIAVGDTAVAAWDSVAVAAAVAVADSYHPEAVRGEHRNGVFVSTYTRQAIAAAQRHLKRFDQSSPSYVRRVTRHLLAEGDN